MNRIDTLGPHVDTLPSLRLVEEDERFRQGMSVIYPPDVTESQRILAAKLSLPHQGFVLGRPRLRALVESVRGGGLVSMVAGPGYGKTAFIVDLLSSAPGRTIYYAVDESDRDPVLFLRCLMAGIGMEVPEPATGGILGWPGGGHKALALELVAALTDFMSGRRDEETLIALDDVHLLDASPDLLGVLELVARGLPPRWTLLLSSRRALALGLDPVQLGGRLVKLGARELRLTPREVAAWARQNWAVVLQPSEARALWRLTEGWPAALVLLGQHLFFTGADIKRKDVVGVISRGRDLRAYLEAQVFSEMEPAVAQVVLAAGLLPRVVFPRDADFLPGGPGEAETILEELAARGFLVARTTRHGFTLHPLLRGFVEREAWRNQDTAGLVERAADHLQRHGEVYHAADLHLRTGAWDKAEKPLRALALSSLHAFDAFADEDWLDLMPDDIGERKPWLLMTGARILQQQADYPRAQVHYQRAAQRLSADNDTEGLLLALLGSAFCLFNQGLWDDCLSVLKRCRTLALSPSERVEVLVCESVVLGSLCRWDEAVENWEKALALAPPAERQSLAARIHLHRARLFYALGHYRVAKQWAEKSLSMCTRPVAPFSAMALNGAAILDAAVGDYDSARARASECLALARDRGYGFVEIASLLNLAATSLGTWQYRQAVAYLREAQELAQRAADAEELFWAEDMLGDLCRRNRNPRLALEHHRKALCIVSENRLAEFEKVRASTGEAIDLILLGREDQGRPLLEATVGLSRRLGLIGSLAPGLFYLGWAYALDGREHEASRMLCESMKLAAEHGHVHFFSQEAQVAVPVMALCDRIEAGTFLREQILPRVPGRLQSYFHELARGPVYPTDVPLGPPRRPTLSWAGLPQPGGEEPSAAMLAGVDSLTDREREVLKMISLGMPNKVIAAKLFITEKTVKTHANHVFRKLDVSNRLQATLIFQSYHRARKIGPRAQSRARTTKTR